MTIEEALDVLRSRLDCEVDPPAGIPRCHTGASIPEEVAAFYSVCGGIRFNTNSPRPFVWRVVPPAEFRPAGYAIYGMEDQNVELLGHWSDSMYLFATTQYGEERIVVDCGGAFDGRYFNGDHETFATGDMQLIALALPELLLALGKCPFERLPRPSAPSRPMRLRDLQG